MSLKNFHVVFIVAAAVLALFCAVQAFGSFLRDGSPLMGAACAASLGGAALLVRYEVLFLRRCRREHIR